MELGSILQALTIVVLIWFGNRVVSVSEKTAVHEERLTSHSDRIKKLEDKTSNRTS